MSSSPALRLFCICEEEMCWCDELVTFDEAEAFEHMERTGTAPEAPCAACKAGIHVRQEPPERITS